MKEVVIFIGGLIVLGAIIAFGVSLFTSVFTQVIP